jgi:hypothetical protein
MGRLGWNGHQYLETIFDPQGAHMEFHPKLYSLLLRLMLICLQLSRFASPRAVALNLYNHTGCWALGTCILSHPHGTLVLLGLVSIHS